MQVFCKDIKTHKVAETAPTDVYSFTAPCTTFSNIGNMEGIEDKDGKGILSLCSLNYITKHKPKVVIAENVAAIANSRHKPQF